METAMKIAQTLDCKGLLCPMPIIKLSKVIKGIQVGEVIEMLATDPGSVPDMEAFQAQTGHEIAAREERSGVYRFLVRRTK
ncbi:MAG: sulfurtransferase TusA family protein [Anaerolineae bacterium]